MSAKLRGYPGSLRHEDGTPACPRVEERIECPECGYPYSEAMVPLWRYVNGVKVCLENDPGHMGYKENKNNVGTKGTGGDSTGS